MLQFILRRIAISALILLMGSALMYFATINAGDPLADLRESRASNRDQLMAARTANMNLDLPWWQRYTVWLLGASKCLVLACDLGSSRDGANINTMLVSSSAASLRLVVISVALAIVIGITLGVLSAIRQYSGFDYTITFLAFLFFSLPVFWAAVLLKDYGAIRFNNWIANPGLTVVAIAVIALIFALLVASVLGGSIKRQAVTFVATGAVMFAGVWYFNSIGWWRQPALGLPLIILGGLLALAFFMVLTTGLAHKKVRNAGLITVALGVISYFVTAPLLVDPSSWWVITGLIVVSILVGAVVGWFFGGFEKKTAMFVCSAAALSFGFLIFMDRLLRSWGSFLQIKTRPISTIGSGMPGFDGTFWQNIFDWGVQLVLPTIVLTLVSIAGYSRYTRASMLETINQDYIRTARSKGLSDRVIYTKHALRNALIPITTIVAFDFAGLLGGAIVTETIFGWKGLGAMFREGLNQVDPGPVMAYYLVAGGAAILMNMLADITYAFLDPRITR
ncbi:MAG: ABC transporter permease [Ornithinimicrobium sp.]|uniref:ABC transporter permease subunit n=1 Tax=Ornithinimicrobium sp. TaxID=1977084 RepID=UPI0026DEF9E0|nr:ABC transporter permease [Ornithinimicrobium sp.]MDO5741122.1 ABC transporter permease [Ornithinimicrobium sp.]